MALRVQGRAGAAGVTSQHGEIDGSGVACRKSNHAEAVSSSTVRGQDATPSRTRPPGPTVVEIAMTLLRAAVRGTDPGTVVEALGRLYPRVSVQNVDASFTYRQDFFGDDTLTIGRLRFGMTAFLRGEVVDTFTTVNRIGGSFRSNRGNAADGLMFAREPTWAHYHHADILVVNLPEAMLRRHGARKLGAETGVLRLHGHHPRPEDAEYWKRALRHVYNDVVTVDELFENDLVRTAAFEYLVTVAEQVLPFETIVSNGAGAQFGSASVRRAVAFMDSHLSSPLTVADVAEAARVTPRALQDAFHREYGKSPMTYLRQARIAAARIELLESDPATTSIATLARRWGFSNAGRFSALYRDQYGESPSTTRNRL
jgi:AraC-like DNA-binding protein